jgi:hypothetical protein
MTVERERALAESNWRGLIRLVFDRPQILADQASGKAFTAEDAEAQRFAEDGTP